MPTTLQQLLDEITAHTDPNPRDPFTSFKDDIGALGHAGRALHALALDGIRPQVGALQDRMVRQLAAACDVAANLRWHNTGKLTDLAGAAADVAGRARPTMGRSERWAVAVGFAAAVDHLAALAHPVTPSASRPVLEQVGRSAAALEQLAQAFPPTPVGAAIMDRLVPLSYIPPGLSGTAATAEAAAALVTAIHRSPDRGGMTLREFRTVCATAQNVSECTVAVAAALSGGDAAAPWRSAAVAWQVVLDSTAALEDNRWGPHVNRTDVVATASTVTAALERDLGRAEAITAATFGARRDVPQVLHHLQLVVNQIPVIAEQLVAVTRHWAAVGSIRAYAADLPRMNNMPPEIIRDVLAGRPVMAVGAALDPLLAAGIRAGRLSTGLADALNRADDAGGPPPQPRLAAAYAHRLAAPDAASRLDRDARHVEQALAAVRTPFQTTPGHLATGPGPGR